MLADIGRLRNPGGRDWRWVGVSMSDGREGGEAIAYEGVSGVIRMDG